MKPYLFVCLSVFFFFSLVSAQTNQDCFECHDDPSFSMEKHGREVSLYVKPTSFSASMHGDLDCIDCHAGFDPDEEPHKAVITPVDCSECHEQAENPAGHSRHPAKVSCLSCHGNIHRPQSAKLMEGRCAGCHDGAQKEYAYSIHSAVKDGPSCIQCHRLSQGASVTSESCLSCHAVKEFVKEHAATDYVEFVLQYKESIHGQSIECSDCHGGHQIVAVDSVASQVNRLHVAATCSECHEDEAESYAGSEHGRAFLSGFESAPTCTDCHGEHDIYQLTDRRSPVSRQHEEKVCLKCHLDSPEVTSRMTHTTGFVAAYEKSIHGRAIREGKLEAAVCSDCHGGHDEMKASNPRSKVYKFNITNTCGECHQKISEEFSRSIHGQALNKGVEEAPTCTNCHGEHSIIEHESSKSRVASQNVSREVCGPCHESVAMAEKFGISAERFDTYEDSYHGLATRFGSVKAANCASCHGVHDILPSSDERSRIYPANLAVTCGQCHPGANENFARGKVHITRQQADGEKLLFWISGIYIFIIVGTIGGMFIHNLLDWIKKIKNRYRQRYQPARTVSRPSKNRLYLRMTLSERIQHFLLLTSFFLLVITGFSLKFPEAWWVQIIHRAGGESLFNLRGLLHRIAAVVMTLDALYHIYYLFFTHRGKQFVRDMMFRWQDVKDLIAVLRYNLGLSHSRPKFDRFSYIEKSEYWALVWGTVVMTVTGIALWFENQFMGWFSKLFVDVCETVHYFEAWLAFLAIVVWHLYFVIFNPDVYPMNFAWLNGKITEEEMEHEHPLELERLKKAEQNSPQEILPESSLQDQV